MALITKNLITSVLGTTKSGKYIYNDPKKNVGFKREDHFDAYCAFARYLMRNTLVHQTLEQHRLAMNEHYMMAANAK